VGRKKFKYKYPPHKMRSKYIIKMPYKRSYRKKSMRRKNPRRRKSKRRKYTKRKKSDNGTFLKVSSAAIPVALFNSQGQVFNPTTTFQHQLRFRIGDEQIAQQAITIANEGPDQQQNVPTTEVTLGTKSAHFAYTQLYKYYQVYKIVVKFYPAVTEGGTFGSPDLTTSQFNNAIQGQITTDLNRFSTDSRGDLDYWLEYPADLKGQSKAMSRKVARNHNLYKPWTRTFTPSRILEAQSNPKSEFQYKPRFKTSMTASSYSLGDQRFVMRMSKPTTAGFVSDTFAGTSQEFPPDEKYVKFGTLQAVAYIKYQQPFN